MHDLVAAGIVEAATAQLAARGEVPSMTQVAQAAGVARATLYRYYPAREDLLAAMVDAALSRTRDQLVAAALDSVDTAEALARVGRVLIPARSQFAVLERCALQLLGGQAPIEQGAVEERLGRPVTSIVERALEAGELRPDLSAAQHVGLFAGVLKTVMGMVERGELAAEPGASLAAAVFLHGAGQGAR